VLTEIPTMPHAIAPQRLQHRAAVLACAALALLAAGCGNSRSQAATQVVAKVNKEEISVHQVNRVLQRQPGAKPEQVDAAGRQVLERLIDQELAVQKAAELRLDREPGVMQAIEAARRDILAKAYMDRQAEATAARPTAEDITAYYDSKPGLFAQRRIYTVQELQVQAGAEALAQLQERVQRAKSMQEVADFLRTTRLPVRASQNTIPAEGLPLVMVDSFARMKEGQAMFLPAPGGARIVTVLQATPAAVTLEQARPAIEQALLNERRRAAADAELKALRSAGRIEYLGQFGQAAVTAASASEPAQADAPTAAASGVDAATVNKGLAGLK
jgi:EpsD family peptidyl-prolyl cis-trans isomerase